MAPGGHAETSDSQPGAFVGARISKSESRGNSAESHSRIGDFISKRAPSVSTTTRQSATAERSLTERTDKSALSTLSRDTRAQTSTSERKPSDGRRAEVEGRRQAGSGRSGLDRVPETRTGDIGDRSTFDRTARIDGARVHRYAPVSPTYVTYYDRPDLVTHSYRYDYGYRDYHGLWCSRLVWPSYHMLIGYNCGSYFGFNYVYPYYHRKYIFVSLGGWWPYDYCYLRYYWYGWHPYYWYGYYPVAQEVETPTYNYYTYNYYTDGQQSATYQSQAPDSRLENVTQQPTEPAEATLADTYFEEGVKAFETAQYSAAIQKFTRAMELAPEDMILPFALSQAMIAGGQYSNAAAVLRDALAKVKPDKEGVFYPRGLYSDEQKLLDQIDLLSDQAQRYSFDADLQLLLGYQLLGIGQTDRAVEPLMNAQKDMVNANAATVLFRLLEKVKSSNSQAAPLQEKPKSIDSPPVPPQEMPADHNHGPAAASSNKIIEGETLGLKENMMLAGMCALVGTAGIRHFVNS